MYLYMAFNRKIMQVLLNKDVTKLGYRGDVVNVKPGYFRNYLFPNAMAIPATTAVLKLVDSRKEKLVIQKQQLMDNAKDVLAKLDGLKLVLKAKASDKGKLYGAIAEAEIIDAVEKAAKVRLEKSFIKMAHIKDLGEFKIRVVLGEGLEKDIAVVVESE